MKTISREKEAVVLFFRGIFHLEAPRDAPSPSLPGGGSGI